MQETSYEVDNHSGQLITYYDGSHYKTEMEAWISYLRYLKTRRKELGSIIKKSHSEAEKVAKEITKVINIL